MSVPAGAGPAGHPVKCVIWDLDNTLLRGVYLESAAQPPPPDPTMTGLLTELGRRGIVHAIASRNPPEAARYAAQATGCTFVAAECGWGRKSEAVARIAAELDIGVDALAFVDDDPYERAEVDAALPGVRVLSPEDAAEAVDWPEFRPAQVTAEARRRAELYQQRRHRLDAERSFGGSREGFLRACATRVTIAGAEHADVPRLHELSERTSQFNSAGGALSAQSFAALISSPAQDVMTVRLQDCFADDGLVGGCVIDRQPAGVWTVPLLMMSCRAIGRGVIDSLLSWLTRAAARHGAATLQVPCVLNDRNVPLRLALASAGFRAGRGQTGDRGRPGGGVPAEPVSGGGFRGVVPPGRHSQAVFRRDLTGLLPALPDYLTAPGEQ
jgi:methoxymalonate biosynthesis protein